MISTGVIFGIIAMIGWGAADFIAASAVRKTGTIRLFLWSQLAGAVPLWIAALLTGAASSLTTVALLIAAAAGLLNVIAYLAYYKGLEQDKLSIISPLSSGYAIITVALSILLRAETLGRMQGVGAVLAIIGTILISFRLSDLLRQKGSLLAQGFKYALVAMLCWGVSMYLVGSLVGLVGWLLPVLLIKSAGLVYILIYARARREKIALGENRVILPVLLIGALELAAFIGFNYGITISITSVVAPIAAAAPAVAVLLAKLFLKEKLEPNQDIGIVLIVAGLILLAF